MTKINKLNQLIRSIEIVRELATENALDPIDYNRETEPVLRSLAMEQDLALDHVVNLLRLIRDNKIKFSTNILREIVIDPAPDDEKNEK